MAGKTSRLPGQTVSHPKTSLKTTALNYKVLMNFSKHQQYSCTTNISTDPSHPHQHASHIVDPLTAERNAHRKIENRQSGIGIFETAATLGTNHLVGYFWLGGGPTSAKKTQSKQWRRAVGSINCQRRERSSDDVKWPQFSA